VAVEERVDDDTIIESFLGERPRATQIEGWLEALRTRLAGFQQEAREAAPDEAARLRGKIRELEQQVAALEKEAAITQFVEDSVRVTLAMGTVVEQGGETP
jgi:hypothetical protein